MSKLSETPGLTPWYSGNIKPVRDGVYQRLYAADHVQYCLFKGEKWGLSGSSVEDALEEINVLNSSWYQDLKWRGLSEQPT